MSREANRYNRIDPAVEARVAELLGRMRLDEKVGNWRWNPFAPVEWGAVLGQMKRAEESGQPFKFPREARADFADRLRAGQVGTIMSAEAPVMIGGGASPSSSPAWVSRCSWASTSFTASAQSFPFPSARPAPGTRICWNRRRRSRPKKPRRRE